MSIDLNADMGEGFGRYRLDDLQLLGVVTSTSVACGFHAGDPMTMRQTVEAAAKRGVVVGAHPSYPDLVGFGRRDMAATPEEIAADVVYQIGALQAMCAAAGVALRYVKPHGALYNRAARDAAVADAITRAVRSVDASLAILALAGGELIAAAERACIRAVREGFLDRAYRADGMLVPRTEEGAVLSDPDAIAERALQMATEGTVWTMDNTLVRIDPESLCTHGDGSDALVIVRAVRRRLEDAGVRIAPFA